MTDSSDESGQNPGPTDKGEDNQTTHDDVLRAGAKHDIDDETAREIARLPLEPGGPTDAEIKDQLKEERYKKYLWGDRRDTEPAGEKHESDSLWKRLSPSVKAGGVLVAGGIIALSTIVATSGDEPSVTPDVTADAGQDSGQAQEPDNHAARPAENQPDEGVTQLKQEPCQSDTDGCDDRGDVVIEGATTEEAARGADLVSVAHGFDFTADDGNGEHQFQITVSGDGQTVSGAAETESYTVTIIATTPERPLTVVLTWQGGELVKAEANDGSGGFRNTIKVEAEWLNEGLLWVSVQGSGTSGGVSALDVAVDAVVPDATGSGMALVRDTASD